MPKPPKLKPKVHKWKFIEVDVEYMSQKILEMECEGWEVFSISVKTQYGHFISAGSTLNIFLRRAWNRRK